MASNKPNNVNEEDIEIIILSSDDESSNEETYVDSNSLSYQEACKLYELMFGNRCFRHLSGQVSNLEFGLRAVPYSTHRQLYLQQMGEQERRRRQSLLVMPRTSSTSTCVHHKHHCDPDLSRYKLIEEIINFLNMFTEKKCALNKDLTKTCIICFNDIKLNQTLRVLECQHEFHRKCVDEWILMKMSCPICRVQVANSENVEGFITLFKAWRCGKLIWTGGINESSK